MATYLDRQDPRKIERALEIYRTEPALEHVRRYAGGDDEFGLWLAMANQQTGRRLGISIFDLGDYTWRDDFEAGSSPSEAVREALENDDTYGEFAALVWGE